MFPIQIFLLIFFIPIFQSQMNFVGDKNVEISYSDEKWEFLMLRTDKLLFNLSDNYYRILRKSELESMDISMNGTNIAMGLHFGNLTPNLDIRFNLNPNDQSLMCHYIVHVNRLFLGMHKFKFIQKKKTMHFDYAEDSIYFGKKYQIGIEEAAFDVKFDVVDYDEFPMEGGGTFNEPVDDPKCLYEFYKIATERSEYELLRYCSKGYFYRGFDLTDPESQFARKDWVLYLMNGMVKCNVSGPGKTQIENNQELLEKGYQLEMVQLNAAPNGKCTEEAVLCQYKDNNKEGLFMMASILGSVIFGKEKDDEEFKCSVNSQRDQNGEGKYLFKLRVGHYCTLPKEYERIDFDLSFNPNDLADAGVQEDKNVEVFLDRGIIRFGTNYLLCADGIDAKECKERKEKMRWALGIKTVDEEPKLGSIGENIGNLKNPEKLIRDLTKQK